MANLPESIVIDGVTYVRKKSALLPGNRRYRVTVTRIDNDSTDYDGSHSLDVITGSWTSALKEACAHTAWFNYHK